MVYIGALGQFGFHMVFSAAQDDGADSLAEGGEIFVILGAAFFIEFIEISVEAEEWAEDGGIEEIDDGVELVNAVLDGRAGEHEGVAALEALDRLGGFCGPVLDALGFVEDDDVGLEALVDVEAINDDLLVVYDCKEGRVTIGVVVGAGAAMAEDDALGEGGEFRNLILPLAFQ